MKRIVHEFKSLRKPHLRLLAIEALGWRLVFIPALLWALPLILLCAVAALAESLVDCRPLRRFFTWPYLYVTGMHEEIYAEAAERNREHTEGKR